MRLNIVAKITGGLLASLLVLGMAQAAELKLKPTQTRIINLAEKPGMIVVSHPEFLSVQLIAPKKILLQGLATGFTNLLVLNKEGKKVANLDITVSNKGDRRYVRVYRPDGRATYVCNPDCALAPTPNDSVDAISTRNQMVRASQSLADSASRNIRVLVQSGNNRRYGRRPR